ncbi:MAG: asparagine synthase (glutamine-hydrolyzing), partial [Acidobacteriaceae bacterium]|nr:asparagine synthase (glutamine-hydrolyzing) [Acidobacteriaceae bacterium]
KIIDLGSGDQPITTAGTTIVFNGEIYNHLELRAELERLGHVFTSHCDTETVLHAFLHWDTDCFRRLRGMFAIALWTELERRLVLARDRMGIKPLFFARRGEDVFFGSELKTIFVHPEIDRKLSIEGLDCYLSMNYVPCPWTLVEGVEKLPPGQWLEWQDGRVSTNAYWTLPVPALRDCALETAKEELDHLLRQSIREHLISDVPLGMWLSGGIDSSTILHYAATESSSRLKTFSISFRGRSFDESDYIQEVANHYNTEHEQLDLNPADDLEGAIEEFAYYSDEPSADAGALPVWFLSKLSKTKTTVSLSGEGADEIFGGYLTHRANQLAGPMRLLPRPVIRFGLNAVRHWPVSDEKIGFEYKAARFLEGSLMSPDRAHVHWNGTFSDPEKHRLLEHRLPGVLHRTLRELRTLLKTSDDLSPYLWFDQKYFLPDDILTKTDRMSMAHSLEVRPPFLDHRIVEFSASLPAALKIRGSRQKVLLKELMKGKLPDSILNRKKIGFDIPAHEWLRGPLRSLLVETITAGASEYSALFRSAAINAYLKQHLERRINAGYHLWGLMVLFLWMKKWRIQIASARSRELVRAKTGTYI